MEFRILSTPVYLEFGFLIVPAIYTALTAFILLNFYKNDQGLKRFIAISCVVGFFMTIRVVAHEFGHFFMAVLFGIEREFVRFGALGGLVMLKDGNNVADIAKVFISAAGGVLDISVGLIALAVAQRLHKGNPRTLFEVFGGMACFNGLLKLIPISGDGTHFNESLSRVLLGNLEYANIIIGVLCVMVLIILTNMILAWYVRGKNMTDHKSTTPKREISI